MNDTRTGLESCELLTLPVEVHEPESTLSDRGPGFSSPLEPAVCKVVVRLDSVVPLQIHLPQERHRHGRVRVSRSLEVPQGEMMVGGDSAAALEVELAQSNLVRGEST